jgi:hypothetical protein
MTLRGWAIPLTAAAIALTACSDPVRDNGIASAGGSGSATVTATGRPGPVDQVRWAQCLREHGIVVDDPNPADPGGGKPRIHDDASTKEQIDAAAEACRAYNPNWGRNFPPDPADVEKQRQFAQCMREHGIDMPDPDAPSTAPAGPEPTPSGPVFDQALADCAAKVPGVVATETGGKRK